MRWKKKTTGRARQLRRRETSYEKTLWQLLRNGRLHGLKFRRQHPACGYFLDFACVSLKLVIELDGPGHLERAKYDELRDGELAAAGWTILRIANHDVVFSLGPVLETIDAAVRRLSPHPNPLPLRGRGG